MTCSPAPESQQNERGRLLAEASANAGYVHTGLLRLLLQGANPKKYGPGIRRKRLLKHERREMRREIEAELELKDRPPAIEQVRESILRKLGAIEARSARKRLAAGWTRTDGGD